MPYSLFQAFYSSIHMVYLEAGDFGVTVEENIIKVTQNTDWCCRLDPYLRYTKLKENVLRDVLQSPIITPPICMCFV